MTGADDTAEWIERFERLAVDPHQFRHVDHLRLGWAYLRRYGLLDGVARFVDALRRFTAHHGASEKFHMTVTVAYLLLIAERLGPSDRSFEAFAAEHSDLFEPHLLQRFYRPETLQSAEARARFIMPDGPRATDDVRPDSEPAVLLTAR